MQTSKIPNSELIYRPDVDGLRALAILAVVSYHVFPEWISGGFIGVDIFFVISGFLITDIIFTLAAKNQFSFNSFYLRRIRRIFPALIVVLVASYILGWFALLPDEYKQLSLHIAEGSFFASNFLLWGESGYFDVTAAEKPLLHLWSLSIEMQFYMVWPLLLYVGIRFKLSFILLLAFGLISFVFNVVFVNSDLIGVFYSPFARAWELVLGGLLAYSLFKNNINTFASKYFYFFYYKYNSFLRNILSLVGLILILVGIFGLNSQSLFPGWWALFPTVGALLIISSGPKTLVNKLALANRFMVWIGLISYPLYLWHWPMLSFLHIMESGTPKLFIRFLTLVVSILFAWLTYKFIELPTQNKHNKLPFIGVLCVLLIFFIAAIGYYTYQKNGFPARRNIQGMPKNYRPIDWSNEGRNTDASCQKQYSFESRGYCLITDIQSPPTVALIGDSHANHFFWGFSAYYKEHEENLLLLGSAGCVPFFDVESNERGTKDNCKALINSSLNFAIETKSIHTIILGSRNSFYTIGHGFGEAEAGVDNRYLNFFGSTYHNDNLATYRSALESTLHRIVTAKKTVIFIFDVPELGFDPNQCIDSRPLRLFKTLRYPCAISKVEFDIRNSSYRKMLDSVLLSFPMVKVFDSSKYLCDSQTCWAILDGKLLYRDNNHLSYDGSIKVGVFFNQDLNSK